MKWFLHIQDSFKEVWHKWGIIKSKQDINIYKDIKFLSMSDKIYRYGKRFIRDVITLTCLTDDKKIKRFIKRARCKIDQIYLLDIFTSIKDDFQALTHECQYRSEKICSLKKTLCSLKICPKKIEILSTLPAEPTIHFRPFDTFLTP